MIFLMSFNFCPLLGNLIMTKLEKEILKKKSKVREAKILYPM